MKFILLILLAFTTSCKKSAAEREMDRLYNNAASLIAYLQQEKGENYEIVRTSWYQSGYVVMKNSATQELVAYQVGVWDPLTMTSLEQFTGNIVRELKTEREWISEGHYQDDYGWKYVDKEEYDLSCNCYKTVSSQEYVIVGQSWVDTSHWNTFYTGGGLKFDNTSLMTKDLETLASLKEDEARGILTQKLKSQYALSANRAQELAGVTYKYMRLENQRELTSLEKDQFAKKALGVSFSDIESALAKKAIGSDSEYAELLKQAAEVNRTSPEMIGKFFDEMISL